MLITQLLVVFCLAFQPAAPDEPLTVQEVLDRWEVGAGLIDSYDLQIEFKDSSYITSSQQITPPTQPVTTQNSFSHIYKSDKKRFGEFRATPVEPAAVALFYDGKILTSTRPARNEYSIEKDFTLFGVLVGEDYEGSYRTLFGPSDRITMSKARASKLLPREGNLYVVEVPQSSPGPWWELTWKVWLDPTRNFMPARWSQWIVKSGRTMHDTDCELDLKEVTSGVWAPIGVNYTIYNKNVNSPAFGKKTGDRMLTVDMAKSKFDVQIPDDRFVMKIPDGVSVIDRIRNVVYTQGSADPEAYLNRLAAEGKSAVAKLPKDDPTSGVLAIVPDGPRFWTKGRIAASVGAIAAVVVAIIAFKRSRGNAA